MMPICNELHNGGKKRYKQERFDSETAIANLNKLFGRKFKEVDRVRNQQGKKIKSN